MDVRFRHIPERSWFLDGLFLSPSPIQGRGVYTSLAIGKEVAVIRWGGTIMTLDTFKAGGGLAHSNVGIDEAWVLAQPEGSALGLDDFMNHSCDPNLGLSDEVTLVAMRDIEAGDELTIDYVIELNDAQYRMKQPCNCGSPCCRIDITGNDWKIEILQDRYSGYFSPFIERKIKKNYHEQ